MSDRLHITFVCTGNICRSPMAQNIVVDAIARAGLADEVMVNSCGTGSWHVGEPADDRARAELRRSGYCDEHTAAVLGAEHTGADLLIAMDRSHLQALSRKRLGDRSRLLRSFDPAVSGLDGPDLDVADPYYGDPSDFTTVREQVEAAVPGLLEWIRDRLGARRDRPGGSVRP